RRLPSRGRAPHGSRSPRWGRPQPAWPVPAGRDARGGWSTHTFFPAHGRGAGSLRFHRDPFSPYASFSASLAVPDRPFGADHWHLTLRTQGDFALQYGRGGAFLGEIRHFFRLLRAVRPRFFADFAVRECLCYFPAKHG